MPVLLLIRGLPGSGKSTRAKSFVQHGFLHYEADDFFTRNGVYKYDQTMISEAHELCQYNTLAALKKDTNVIVANTFTRISEMEPYFNMAFTRGARLACVQCTGNYGSIHNVPEEVVQRMRSRWEPLPWFVPLLNDIAPTLY